MGCPLNNTNTNTNTWEIVLAIPLPIQLKIPIPIPLTILLVTSADKCTQPLKTILQIQPGILIYSAQTASGQRVPSREGVNDHQRPGSDPEESVRQENQHSEGCQSQLGG